MIFALGEASTYSPGTVLFGTPIGPFIGAHY